MPWSEDIRLKFARSASGIVPVRTAKDRDWFDWIVPSEVAAILAPTNEGCIIVLKNGREITSWEAASSVAALLFPPQAPPPER